MNKAKGTNTAAVKRKSEYSSSSMVWLFGLGKIGKRLLLSNSFISCSRNHNHNHSHSHNGIVEGQH